MAETAPYDFDRFISLDIQALCIQALGGFFLVAIGIWGMFGGLDKAMPIAGYDVATISKVAGGVVSAVGMFPFNKCWARWERIQILRSMKLSPAGLEPETVRSLLAKMYADRLKVEL